MQSTVQNIQIGFCSFTQIVSNNNGVFIISNLGKYSSFDMYGGYTYILSSGSSTKAYIFPRKLIFSNMNFSNITYSGIFLSTSQHPNIYIENFHVNNTNDMSYNDYNTFVINNFVNSPSSYIIYNLQSELITSSICRFVLSLANSNSLLMKNSSLSQTSCTGISGINYVSNINVVLIQSLSYSNTYNSDNYIWLFSLNRNLTLNSLTLNNLQSYYSAVFLISITNYLLLNNFTGISLRSDYESSIQMNYIGYIKITNFKCNTCFTTYANGGSMVIIPSAVPSVVILQNFYCNECSAFSGFGGAVYFHSFSTTLAHNVTVSNFLATNCVGSDGAAIYISSYFSFNVGSFTNVTIRSSSGIQGGVFSDNH